MRIADLVWLEDVVTKIARKHQVSVEEVEEVFYNRPRFRRTRRGHYAGEDLYYAYGRTDIGRYLLVVFILKRTGEALIVTARDMDRRERRTYARK